MGFAHAGTIVVTDGGDNGNSGTCTLRQALASANADQVTGSNCAEGSGADVLTFSPTLINATITLAGTPLLVNSEIAVVGIGQTIDAAGTSRVLQVIGNANLHADYLTLTGGHTADDGGGILISNSQVVLSHVTVVASSADQNGGGIHVDTFAGTTRLDLDHVTLEGNSATHGAGLSVSTEGNGTATITLTDLNIASNTAGGMAGGIRIASPDGTTSVTLDHSIIRSNAAYLGGGGLAITNSGSSIAVTDSIIATNQGADGGGLFVYNSATASLSDSTVVGNSSDYGGGVSVKKHGSVSIDQGKIYDNIAEATGKYGGFGGGLFAGIGSTVSLSATTISGNTADHGGGLVVAGNKAFIASTDYDGSNGAHIVVLASTISGNRAIWGSGAAYAVNGGVLDVINSSLVDNSADLYGGGVEVRGLASANLVHTTIVGNAAFANPGNVISVPNDPGGLVVWPGCTVDLSNSVLADNRVLGRLGDAHVHPGGTLRVNSSLLGTRLQADFNSNGNVFSDAPGLGPLMDNGGPTLSMAPQPGSLVTDAGDNLLLPTGVTTDQRGAGYPRIRDVKVDMGAIEGFGDVIFKDDFES